MRDYRRLYGAAMTKLAAEATKEEKQAPAESAAPAPSAGAKLDGYIAKGKDYLNSAKARGKKFYGDTKDFFSNPNHLKRMGFGLGGGVIGALLGGPKNRILGALLGGATGVSIGDLVADQSYIRDSIAEAKRMLARRKLLKEVGMTQEEFNAAPTEFYRRWGKQKADAAAAAADTDLLTNTIAGEYNQSGLRRAGLRLNDILPDPNAKKEWGSDTVSGNEVQRAFNNLYRSY